MSRFKVTISGIFDSDNISNDSDSLILHLVRGCCPGSFGLDVDRCCNMTNCLECWDRALEAGVKNGVKSVHVRRLD